MRRYLLALVVALTFAFGAPHAAQARARLDARVDALSAHTLLTRDAAHLVDQGRQRRARVISDLQHVASVGWGLSQILAFWWLWRSGTGARIRDAMRRRTRNRTAHRAVFGAAIGALAPLASLPFAVMGYRVAFSAGLTDERFPAWFVDYALRVALDALLGAIIVAGVLALVERMRVWYLVVAAVIAAGALGAVMAEPLLPFGTPAKATPRVLTAQNVRIAQAVGVHDAPPVIVTATSRHTNALTFRTAGIGPTTRVVVGDLDLVHFTPAELATILARGDVHVQREDPLRLTLFGLILFVLSAAIAVLLSDRVGFRRDDDALSRLALVATFLGVVLVATYPIYNAYARHLEAHADGAALAAVPDRASTVRAFVRYADINMVPICGRRSIRWYFDDRPPLGGRIAAAAGTGDPCGVGSGS